MIEQDEAADDAKKARHASPPGTRERDARSEERVLAWVRLHCLGVSAVRAAEIVAAGGPQSCFARGLSGLRPWLSERQWQRLLGDTAVWERSLRWVDHVSQFILGGGHVLTPDTAFWRARVLDRLALPMCVYARGNLQWLSHRPCVAIVGSRRPTPTAAQRAHHYAHALTSRGALICSGGAWGIDLAAHCGGLAAGGGTIAVLGEPLDPTGDERPNRVRGWAEQALTLLPHGPWVPMSRRLFVSRNRWIAALCDALVVVEGAARSGTSHTAKAAIQFGVPIYAVPGDPDAPNSDTPNRLIAEGVAHSLLRIEELISRFGLGRVQPKASSPQLRKLREPQRNENPTVASAAAPLGRGDQGMAREAIQQLLAKETPLSIEGLAERLGVSLAEVLRISTLLELEGHARKGGIWLHRV